MSFTGTIYHNVENELGTINCVETGGFLLCTLTVGGQEAVRVPFAIDSAITDIAIRMTNIINQTGLVTNTVRVEMDEPE